MTDQVIGHITMIILLAAIMFQQQLTAATSEPASIPEDQSDDDVFHCAALGCPGNPPNPHGPPTEEPEGDG
jgi:hypothetical protein